MELNPFVILCMVSMQIKSIDNILRKTNAPKLPFVSFLTVMALGWCKCSGRA